METCPKCGSRMTLYEPTGMYYCKPCLQASFLTDEAQKEAQKRYRQSSKGKIATHNYEQSEKGKVARLKYFKSPKYKQRRKEYNERIRESLRIARQAGTLRGQRERLEPLEEPPEIDRF